MVSEFPQMVSKWTSERERQMVWKVNLSVFTIDFLHGLPLIQALMLLPFDSLTWLKLFAYYEES